VGVEVDEIDDVWTTAEASEGRGACWNLGKELKSREKKH
jgi:hypothetical protein